jgi:hypothetical protein
MRNAQQATTATLGTLARVMVALAVALVLGSMLVPSGEAAKKGKNTIASVKDRVQGQRDLCETLGGGTMTVSTTPFGATITDCEGGTHDGQHCVNTNASTTCTTTRDEDGSILDGVTVPLDGVAAASLTTDERGRDERDGKHHRRHDAKRGQS